MYTYIYLSILKIKCLSIQGQGKETGEEAGEEVEAATEEKRAQGEIHVS